MKRYDLIIIGTGGGTKLRPAADLGKKVAIIEKESLGGTCLNWGCIPSKMLIYPADLATHWRENHKKFFMTADTCFDIDFEALVARVTKEVTTDSQAIKRMYDKHPNIDLYEGHARFAGPKVVEVNKQKLTAEKIYIATGSRPHIPSIPGLKDTPFMTSRQALRNTKLPQKMIVLGGGYIAAELGHMYGAFGTEVHFLVRSSMLRSEDKDIRETFEQNFSSRYKVHFGVVPERVEYKEKTFFITVRDRLGEKKILEADSLFVATGVVPNSDNLGLENTAVQVNEKGYIKVNDYLETDQEGVYALGDVIGKYLFRHSVNFEGEYLFNQHYKKVKKSSIKYPPMPHAVFSSPQVAGVGITEDELERNGKVKGKDYFTAVNHYKNSAMGMAMRPDCGMVKLIADKQSKKLIGAHVVGERASDIIHTCIAYMTMEVPVDRMLEMVYIHPALSENLRNAVRKLLKAWD